MASARHLPAADYLALKASFRELVALCGGVKRAAEITRGCVSRLSEAMSPHHPDRFPALDQIADLEAECGIPVVSRQLAALAGASLSEPQATPNDTALAIIAGIKEAADLQAVAAQAMADGNLSDTERQGIAREAEEAVAALNRVILAMRGTKPRAVA